jgi:hypothetical protein
MNAHIFERTCPLYQEGAIRPIFEGDMPPKKMTPKSCPVNGTVTGILLKQTSIHQIIIRLSYYGPIYYVVGWLYFFAGPASCTPCEIRDEMRV